MTFFDIFKMACGNFTRRKARTMLTVLGVVIGAMAVVIMLSIGQGLEKSYTDQLSSWGSLTQIEINGSNGDAGADGTTRYMDEKLVEEISQMENVVAVMPVKRTWATLIHGRDLNQLDIMGIDMSKLEYYNFKMAEGTNLTADMPNGYIIGYEAMFNFRNPKDDWEWIPSTDDEGNPAPLPFDILTESTKLTLDTSYYGTGKKPRMESPKCLGVMKQSWNNYSYAAVMDISLLDKYIKNYEKSNKDNNNKHDEDKNVYSTIYVEVNEIDNVVDLQEDITSLGFWTNSSAEMLDNVKEQMAMIQMVLGGIGAVAFLIAAIGISNTMVMSTYERTREIGIMKVLGCKLSDIMTLFLMEAALIGLAGGILGVTFSKIVSMIINYVASSGMIGDIGMSETAISIIPLWLAIGGLVFTSLIGLISGIYPAYRAMNLSALEAMKNE